MVTGSPPIARRPPARPAPGPASGGGRFAGPRHTKRAGPGAAGGDTALAPAVFDRVEPGFEVGYKPEDIERGRGVRGKLGMDDMVRDVRAAVTALAAAGLKVGVVGYCMGGSRAWLAATRIDGLRAAVGYYGGAIAEHAAERPRCPVLLHWGETDQAIPSHHWQKVAVVHPTIPLP